MKTAKHKPIFLCMIARRSLPVVMVLVAFSPCAFGQSPERLEKCPTYPTSAQEIRDMQLAPTPVRVHVIRVDFDSNDSIPTDAQEEISAELRSHLFEPDADSVYLKDLANEIAEVPVMGALRDRGYFRATATAKLTALHEKGADISVVVAISAALGPQYRTGEIRIESADNDSVLTIAPEVLRGLMPFQRGELFSVGTIRAGLRNITQAYVRNGYIDMTAEPDFEIDDAHNIIDMVVKVDQQAQYRVGSIEFQGVNTVNREKLMESLPKPGEVFDGTRLDEFFKVNRAILPSDFITKDVNVRKDLKTKTVAISFGFRTCPLASN